MFLSVVCLPILNWEKTAIRDLKLNIKHIGDDLSKNPDVITAAAGGKNEAKLSPA